jgi:hypothetical protein
MLTGQRANNGFGGVMPPDRGLPENLGYGHDYGRETADIFGYHSQTWWTLREMKDAVEEADRFAREDWKRRESAFDRFMRWIRLGEILGNHHEAETEDDVRYVVGYDS